MSPGTLATNLGALTYGTKTTALKDAVRMWGPHHEGAVDWLLDKIVSIKNYVGRWWWVDGMFQSANSLIFQNVREDLMSNVYFRLTNF